MYELIILIIIIIVTLLAAILALVRTDLLEVAILSGITGLGIALMFQLLLAPDVALTQAIVGAGIIPVFLTLAIKKTTRVDDV